MDPMVLIALMGAVVFSGGIYMRTNSQFQSGRTTGDFLMRLGIIWIVSGCLAYTAVSI